MCAGCRPKGCRKCAQVSVFGFVWFSDHLPLGHVVSMPQVVLNKPQVAPTEVPLEACRQFASSGTEKVPLEPCREYASSGTDHVPVEACAQNASSGINEVPLGAGRPCVSNGNKRVPREACRQHV